MYAQYEVHESPCLRELSSILVVASLPKGEFLIIPCRRFHSIRIAKLFSVFNYVWLSQYEVQVCPMVLIWVLLQLPEFSFPAISIWSGIQQNIAKLFFATLSCNITKSNILGLSNFIISNFSNTDVESTKMINSFFSQIRIYLRPEPLLRILTLYSAVLCWKYYLRWSQHKLLVLHMLTHQ